MDAPAHLTNKQAFSNHELRKEVALLAISIRGLEAESRRQEKAADAANWDTPNWFEATRAQSEKTSAYVGEQFAMHIRPVCISLRDEILRRLGSEHKPEERGLLNFDLAGNGLENAATGLEQLVRLLPN